MNEASKKLPVALAFCEQLISISLGNFEGPGSPEDALALIEGIVERSEFSEEDEELVRSKLSMAHEVMPKQAAVHQLKPKSKTARPDNRFDEMFRLKQPARA